jgi:CBS domain-containing protein
MKAASIALRIADFLKDFPPFEFFQRSELIELASTGRVRFHEAGETIFTTGMPRDRFIYVVNQGRVRIEEVAAAESGAGTLLLDLRGPGELLGLHGVLTDAPYLGTATAETEVLLYCLPRRPFLELTERSRRAKRYLLAYFSLNGAVDRGSLGRGSRYDAITPTTLRRRGLAEVDPPQAIAADALLTVREDTPALEAARMLQPRRARCVIVVDSAGRPVGKLTDSDLRERFIEGRVLANETAGTLMMTDLTFARRTDDTGRLLIRLARTGKRYLVVTEDGTAQSKALGLVTERNIFMQYGRFPTLLAEAMREAPTIAALATLRDRMESLILEFIEDRSHVPWLMEMTGVLNRAIVARLEHLAGLEMAAEGWRTPSVDHTWLIMGSGGRDELLIRSAVYHAILYDDPTEDERAYTELYFHELGNIVSNGLRRCGFPDNEAGILASNPEWCLARSAMHAWYSRMIADPVGTNVYAHRDAFDFRPIVHLHPLAAALRQHINIELQRHPEFLRHMAKDSLLNQPPRTIFQQYVINEQGEQKEELAIKHHALLPLVDAARVLALATGEVASTATYLRFRAAAAQLDEVSRGQAELLREAAEAFLVLAYARARQGLLSGTSGAVIRPADVEPETRPLLKTAFRTILSTLEHLAARYGLSMRLQ